MTARFVVRMDGPGGPRWLSGDESWSPCPSQAYAFLFCSNAEVYAWRASGRARVVCRAPIERS